MSEYAEALSRLVAIDTVSPIDARQLHRCGAELARHGCRPVGDRLFGYGNATSEVWLYGHVDTKPPTPIERWATDPFTLTEVTGRWYGLGISDSKFQLLNALTVAEPARHFVLIDTSEESDGCAAAAEYVFQRKPATLVICDGARRADADVYGGYRGQADGVVELRTGVPTHHPGRPGGDVAGPLRAFLAAVASSGLRFTLTGLAAPATERSLALQEVDVRFDIRFAPDEEPRVQEFLAAWPHRLRQYLAAVAGRRDSVMPDLTQGGLAGFSSRLGQLGPLPVEQLVVAPGADADNANHQPNEFIRPEQIMRHQQLLRRVLDAVEEHYD